MDFTLLLSHKKICSKYTAQIQTNGSFQENKLVLHYTCFTAGQRDDKVQGFWLNCCKGREEEKPFNSCKSQIFPPSTVVMEHRWPLPNDSSQYVANF